MHKGKHHTKTMVFSWPAFNAKYRYYWWLPPTQDAWAWMIRVETPWPRTPQPAGCTVMDERDYPNNNPPLNRNCRENIFQTIVGEYDTMWARREHLHLYFRVYASMSNRLMTRIVQKGLASIQYIGYNPAIVVDLITAFLPSEPIDGYDKPFRLPVDSGGFRAIADKLVMRRKQKREVEEATLKSEKQAEKECVELTQCLICRGMELLLQRCEWPMETGHQTTAKRATSVTHQTGEILGRKRKRLGTEEVSRTDMNTLKLIYKKIHEFN